MQYINNLKGVLLEDLIPSFEERGIDLNLERMQLALKAMEEPCKLIPAIQIAGTNGKGSIASFINSCLQSLGIKAGITTSPHLITWCERICINGETISPNELEKILITLKPIIDDFKLTPFESLIACAFDHFRREEVELLVLEVGLGGRLDATTAHKNRPIIALGGIGLDHCDQLGNTLKAITKEKASIILPESTVITAQQHPDVEKTLKEICSQREATLHIVKPLTENWDLGLPGEIQKQNAAVAKVALESLRNFGWEVNDKNITEGLANAFWPGRLQKARWNKTPLIIDCAHNPHATKQLSLERKKWSGEQQGVHWILAIQKQKDAPAMLKSLIKPNDFAWIIPVPNHHSWLKEELLKECPQYCQQLKEVFHIEEALSNIAIESAQQEHLKKIVITGSMYLLGDLIKRKVIKLKFN